MHPGYNGECIYGRANFTAAEVGTWYQHGQDTTPAACKDADGNEQGWCMMKQRALPGQYGDDAHGGVGEHNPCGWDCRDGSLKGVQCAYDQPCLRISRDQTEVAMPLPHNMLVSGPAGGHVLPLSEEVKAELFRPQRCGGADDQGMRCAGDIHRAVTSHYKTPEPLRDPNMEMIEFQMSAETPKPYAGDLASDGWTTHPDVGSWANITNPGKQKTGYWFGQKVPEEVFANPGVAYYAASGEWKAAATAPNTADARTQGGIIAEHTGAMVLTCRVKYSTTEPLHVPYGNKPVEAGANAAAAKRSTLLVQACWDSGGHCGDWGLTSKPPHTTHGRCTVAGPRVTAPVPSPEQRKALYRAFAHNSVTERVTYAELVRTAFHDAGTFSNQEGAMKSGANGCMRFEEVHGSAPNSGLAFGLDSAAKDIISDWLKHTGTCAVKASGSNDDCGAAATSDACTAATASGGGSDAANECVFTSDADKVGYSWGGGPVNRSPFSDADLYQFAAIAAVAEMGGTNITSRFRWGRPDAPYMWCQGETQSNLPDFSGGHKHGWHTHGAGKIAERLQSTFDVSKEYFESVLGLSPRQWVALLGAHSVGKVSSLDPGGSKVAKIPFDSTPTTFDNQYFKDIELFKDSAMISACPQSRRPGEAHWYIPMDGVERTYSSGYTALLDTDVSMTVEGDYLWWIRTYAADETAFHCEFSEAFLHVSELGYDSENYLIASWDAPTTPFECGLDGPAPKEGQCDDVSCDDIRKRGYRHVRP